MNTTALSSQLSDVDYWRFRDLILARTGMLFGPRRRDALAHGLSAAAGRTGRENLGQYYRLLQWAKTDSEPWDDLLGAITVGETYFFRNPAQFDALRYHILPDLIARHRDDRRLRIWSAGCATGEEPYSLAILLRQLLPDIAHWNIFVLATDINKQALRWADEGRYREWSFRRTDPAIHAPYFTKRNGPFDLAQDKPFDLAQDKPFDLAQDKPFDLAQDKPFDLAQDKPFGGAQGKPLDYARNSQDKYFELSPQVRKMVAFAYLNLVEDSYPSLTTNTNAMDLILCRNVAIYLPEAVIQEMVERFHRCLVPEGWLIVGAAETNGATYRQFAVRNFPGAIVYQKVAEPLAALPFPELVEGPRPERACSEPSQKAEEPPPLHPEPLDFVRGVPVEGQPSLPTESYQEGLALLGQGRYEEAMPRFLAHLEREPDFAPAYYQMARIHANRGRLAEARSWCQQAIERDPLLTEAHYTLALIYQEEGTLEQAVAQFSKTLYLDPNFVLAHFSLSNIYQQMDRRDGAARHRMQAIRLAAKMPADHMVPGSDGLTAARLLTMVQATL
jgi:chemotaxis protein methyltransferase CheR